MSILIPNKTLNDGFQIPVLGLGVFKVENDITCDVVSKAIQSGIRLIDTAQAYNNEEGTGKGILCSSHARKDLFITTKIRNSNQGYDRTIQSVRTSLKLLNLEYIDLILVHWPVPSKNQYVETYRALEQLQKDGLVRSIGVSNFNISHLIMLMDSVKVIPSLNQIEIHPYFTNDEVIAYCKKSGIAVQAWSPLGKGAVLEDETILSLAKECNLTPAQIVLRWHYQNDVLTIPKSTRIERVVENSNIFTFSLNNNQMHAINVLNREFRTGPDPDLFAND